MWEENLLEECRALLVDVSLFPNVSDKWMWLPNPMGGYLVRDTYDLLSDCDTSPMDSALDLVWHHQVPLKVSVFAWRFLQDRLPTKANLAVYGIIHSKATYCVAGCSHFETSGHLFLSCTTFASLW